MKTIYLTGFMGSGKTTIGKILANKLGVDAIDTDFFIEQKYGYTIKEIFQKFGEEYFRTYETETLRQLPVNDTVIMTGGGIILSETNRNWMKSNGVVIYLKCDPSEIYKRLENDQSRPLISMDKQKKIQELLEARIHLYEEASIIIDTTGQGINDLVDKLITEIKIHQNGNTKSD